MTPSAMISPYEPGSFVTLFHVLTEENGIFQLWLYPGSSSCCVKRLSSSVVLDKNIVVKSLTASVSRA